MRYTVLVVDDSKLARMAAAKILRAVQPDWQLVEATDADEALATAREAAIDVSLIDFNMRGRDGLALAADLLALNPAMPVAIVSANHQSEVVSRAHEIGAVFLPKPLTEPTLRAFLEDGLSRLQNPPL